MGATRCVSACVPLPGKAAHGGAQRLTDVRDVEVLGQLSGHSPPASDAGDFNNYVVFTFNAARIVRCT